MEPAPDQPCELTLELDEVWSFVRSKWAPIWLWIALCRETRQVVAYALGDRSEATARQLWERVPAAYRLAQVVSDEWAPYAAVISPAQYRACAKQDGETAHVERWNNTLRQRIGRYTRKSLSFSKSEEMHEVCIRLFLHRYNLYQIIL